MKQFKAVKSGKRARLDNEKAKRQTLVQGSYQQQKAELKVKKLAMADKLWEDDGFKHCKMDDYCAELADSLEVELNGSSNSKRNFCCWVEGWEKKNFDPQVTKYLKQDL